MDQSKKNEPLAETHISTALLLFLLICILGSLGFMWIEEWNFQKALFFTLISITTVGYGDEGISEAGKLYALAVVLGGFGVTTFTFSLLMQRAVSKGFGRKDQMKAQIEALKAHTIVCGFGRMGQTICSELKHDGAAFVVIEESEEASSKAIESGFLVVRGGAADDDILLQAGVERAAHIISAVDGEVENIAVTLSASELNPEIEIIARAERDTEMRKLRRAGASRTVSPFRAGGLDAANAVLHPAIADCLDHASDSDCPVELTQIAIHPGSYLEGIRLSTFGQAEGRDVAFVALQTVEANLVISPIGATELAAGDILIVAGRSDRIRSVRDLGSNAISKSRGG